MWANPALASRSDAGGNVMNEQRRARILVVDASDDDRERARAALETAAQVECCSDADSAVAALRREPADLVVTDLSNAKFSGLELLERIRREHPGTDVILLAANASVESASSAMRLGAADYLRKPTRAEDLALAAWRTLARRSLVQENARLRDTLQTVEACRALTTCLEVSEVYPLGLELLLHSLGRTQGLAFFHRSSLEISDALAVRGLGEAQSVRLRELLIEDKRIDLDVFREIEIIDHGPLLEVLREAGIEVACVLAVPIRGQDKESGIWWILGEGEGFSEDDLDSARIVAGQAGLSLFNAEKYNQAREKAFVDDVTELYNARYLHKATEHEIQRAERYGSTLSVLFLDIDRFKQVNDRYGHLVGSRTLKQLGQVLSGCVRQVDTLARYGGDEFTILLVDTQAEAAKNVADRIRRTVEETWFDGGRDGALRLTLSIGVGTYPSDGRSREGLLDVADKAMYRAKSLGRNRVCTAGDLAAAEAEAAADAD